MTQIEQPLPANTPQRRLMLNYILNETSRDALESISHKGQFGRLVLEDLCKILCSEVGDHAARQPRTREQSCYLVGWHDALHSIRLLANELHGKHTGLEERSIAGVPGKPSFPDTVSIQEATGVVMWRGNHFMTVDEENIARLDGRHPPVHGQGSQHGHNFQGPGQSVAGHTNMNNPANADGDGDDPMSRGDIFELDGDTDNTPPPRSLGSTINLTVLDGNWTTPADKDGLLYASDGLRCMDTAQLLMLFERQSRLSENKIAQELAKTSFIRQAIFQDRFFGHVPEFEPPKDWWNKSPTTQDLVSFQNQINTSFLGDAQQDRAIRDARETLREWHRDAKAEPQWPPKVLCTRGLQKFDSVVETKSAASSEWSSCWPTPSSSGSDWPGKWMPRHMRKDGSKKASEDGSSVLGGHQ